MFRFKWKLFSICMSLFILTLFLSSCQSNEFSIPKDYQTYATNLTNDKTHRGFIDWKWGINPDSIKWRDYTRQHTLSEFIDLHPEWKVTRKSGSFRYSLNLLPRRFNTAFDIRFNSVHLFFSLENELARYERVFDSRTNENSEIKTEEVFRHLKASLSKSLGNPHQLPKKELKDNIFQEDCYLWKCETEIIDLILYTYPDGRSIISQSAQIYLNPSDSP